MSYDSDNCWEIRNYAVSNTGWTRIDLSGFWDFRLQLTKGGLPADAFMLIAANAGQGATTTGTGGTFTIAFGAVGSPAPISMHVFTGAHFPTITSEWWVMGGESDMILQVLGIRRQPAR